MIQGWLDKGVEKGATHLIVACDTFDWEDYPVWVDPGQDVRLEYDRLNGPNMQKVMEVYCLSMPLEPQLDERRAFNF